MLFLSIVFGLSIMLLFLFLLKIVFKVLKYLFEKTSYYSYNANFDNERDKKIKNKINELEKASCIAKQETLSKLDKVECIMQETISFDSKEDLIFNTNFQYVEIDEKSLEILKEKDLREPLGNKKVELKKWCVDTKHPIALLYTGWVSCAIARTDGSSYWYFLLMVNGNYTEIEFARQGGSINAEKEPIEICEINISSDFAEKSGFTVKQLKVAVCEAIRVIEIGEKNDYRKECELEEQEEIQKTPNKILHGEFSEMLKQCINSITEIENMEQYFRNICLRHFKKHNREVQNYSRFYLHNDEDSYFIFDVIIWMYLHIDKNVTIKKIIEIYPSISNENYMYRRDVYEQHFCIAGSLHFLTEHYFTDRIKEEKIILNQGKIQFSQQHLADIIEKLYNEKEAITSHPIE